MWKIRINIEGLSRFDKKVLIDKITIYGGFILSFVVGILIGYLFIILYQRAIIDDQPKYQENKEKHEELNLLISKNNELIFKYDKLLNDLSRLKTIYSANTLVQENIKNYKVLLGEVKTTGSGINLTIAINLDDYWLIDILNELFDLGAETIAINGNRLTSRNAILKDDSSNQLYLGNTPLEAPYVIQAIGNPDILIKGLSTDNGLISRLEESFPDKSKNITLKKEQIYLDIVNN